MDDNGALLNALADEAKRLIIDSTYSGRGHQQAGQRWSCLNTVLGLPMALLSTLLASGAALNALFGEKTVLTAALALAAALLTATHAFFHPDQLAELHGLKGDRYISLRNDVRLFYEVRLRLNATPQELAAELRQFRERYNALTESPPRRIPRRDYQEAKRSIDRGESGYENDPLWEELGKSWPQQ